MISNALTINHFFKKPQVARAMVLGALLLLVIDMVYSNINGINQLNRDTTCILYTSMPRWLFLIYEYFFELVLVILLGVFASTLIERYFKKVKRFFPKNQVLAFVYGAILPICSCGAVPLIEVMKQRVSLRVIVTFVIAAPLLNPYIVVLSLSIFGLQYTLVRIAASFVLAVLTGLIVDFAGRYTDSAKSGVYAACKPTCSTNDRDPFIKALRITKSLLPFIIVAGLLSLGLELFNPKQYLSGLNFSNSWLSVFIMAVVGVPLYVCNGADLLLLKPLLEYTDLTFGSAMVFSLTSSAVCVSSVAMLFKFLGKKLTWVLVGAVTLISVLIGILLNAIL